MNDREITPYQRIAELERENAALRAAYSKLETDLMDEVDELRFENAGLRVELEQQAICNGAGASRELALRSTIAELQRENLALRADKERLDWLDTNCVFIAVEGHCDKRLINARHTIDAARKEQP